MAGPNPTEEPCGEEAESEQGREALHTEISQLREECENLRRKLAEAESTTVAAKTFRQAALNLMEDAVAARSAAEVAEETVRRGILRQGFLLQLSDAFRQLNDTMEIKGVASRSIGEFLGVDWVFHSTYTYQGDQFTLACDYCKRDEEWPAEQIPITQYPSISRVLQQGQFFVVPNVRASGILTEPEKKAILERGVAAFACVPLLGDEVLMNSFAVATATSREWRAEEITLLADAAERAWAAMRRTEVEESLRVSEERFRAIVSQTTAAIGQTDGRGRFVFANLEYRSLTGYTDRELLGKSLIDITHPDDQRRHQLMFDRMLENGLPFGIETRFRQRNGSVVWAHNSVAGLLNSHGKVTGAITVSVNITERKAAEQGLRESENRMRTLADAVLQLIWTNDGKGFANYFNQRWFQYSGLSYEEAAGPGWQRIVHPEDAAGSMQAWRQALEQGKPFECEYRLRRHDGEFRWFIGRNIQARSDGRITSWFGSATDIHELKQAEESVRSSEEQFRRAIQEAPIPVIMHAEDGQVLQISRTWTELTGYRPEDIPTFDAWMNRAYGAGADSAREHMQSLFLTRAGRKEVVIQIRTRDGRIRQWVFRTSEPGTLKDGRRFIVGMALDITERQQATQDLAASEERLRVALEAARMASWDMDITSGSIVGNVQHFQLLGLPPSTHHSVEDFLGRVHPQSRDEVRENLQQALERTGVYRSDFRIIRGNDGAVRWMSGFGQVIPGVDGKSRRMTGVMFDTTDQREAQDRLAAANERLRILVDSSLEHAIITTDLERRIESWNPGAERIIGYRAEEVRGKLADLIFTEEDRAAGAPEREMQQALREGRGDDNRWQLRKDGTKFWANGAMVPMRASPEGQLVGFLKILRDETAMHEAKEAVEQSRAQLLQALQETEQARAEAEAAGQAKDHFLAVLSHELRTPLTPVLLATYGLLRRKDISEPIREMLAMIRRNILIEASFVDDLLDVTKISRGKMELMIQTMNLHEALQHAVDIARPDIDAKEQNLRVRLHATEYQVEGDNSRLQQAIWNLLKNASKFTPKAGEISIETRNKQDRVTIDVKDTGIGIDPEALSRIFQPFSQADDTIARKFGGLGLGLAIAKASIEGHGGELTATSEGLAKGATFSITLPLFRETAHA